MSDDHLSKDQFLTHLTTLLTTTHSTSHATPSVFLSQKPHPTTPSSVLIRATNGLPQMLRKKDPKSKIKLSTVVEVGELEGFYSRYAEVCKKGMEGLRKRDKKKGKGKKRKGKAAGGGK